MLIHFFTDRNFNLTGFYAHYTVSDCIKNCSSFKGRCDPATHTCSCQPGYTGEACDQIGCSDACGDYGSCDYNTYRCVCNIGYVGYDCSLLIDPDVADVLSRTARAGWHVLVPQSTVFTTRAGHAGAWIAEHQCLYIFGGDTLNELLSDLVYYCVNTTTVGWRTVDRTTPWPSARHGHTIVSGSRVRLYMFGGATSDEYSNELWMFDVTTARWTTLAASSGVQPNGVTGHSMTLVDDNWIYVLGGRTQFSGLVADMYRIDVSQEVLEKSG